MLIRQFVFTSTYGISVYKKYDLIPELNIYNFVEYVKTEYLVG